MKRQLEQIARHRNGICGEPFYVAIVHDTVDGKRRRFVITQFHETVGAATGADCCTAVLEINELSRGNIAMARGNSWRGDHWHDWMAEQIAEYEKEPVQ